MDYQTSGFFVKDEGAAPAAPAPSNRFLIGGILLCIDALCLVVFRILFQTGILDFDFLKESAPWLHQNLGEVIYTIGLFVLVMGLMPLLVFSRQEGKRLGQLADDFGLKKPDIRYILISIPLGIAFYFATMVAAYIFNIILTLLGVFPRASDPMLAGVGPMIFTLLVSAVAPGIFEELFYRSTMQYSLTGTRDGGKKIVFMAMIFSLAHQYIYQTGYTFVGGIILGYLYYKTRSIYPAMIVHFMNNGIGILMEAIEVNGWNGGAIVDAYFSMDVGTLVLIGFVMAGVAFGLLVAIKKISDNKKKEQTMKAQLAGIPIATQQRHVPTPMEKAVWATGIALMLLNTLFTLFWAYV